MCRFDLRNSEGENDALVAVLPVIVLNGEDGIVCALRAIIRIRIGGRK